MVLKTVIVDLGNVLLTLSRLDEKNKEFLSSICRTLSWFNYEKGLMKEEEAYISISVEIGGVFSPEMIEKVINIARSSLRVENVLLDLLKILQSSGRYRLFAMSNISESDYKFVESEFGDVLKSVFEEVYPSYKYGDRKPNLSFFSRVLNEIGAYPCETLFIDDEIDNIVGASSIGIRSLLFDKDNISKSIQLLHNLCNNDPCQSAMSYLRRYAGEHFSITSDGRQIKENFSQLLLLEATNDKSLVNYIEYTRLFHFFQDDSIVSQFPFDIDTTSIGLTVMKSIPLSVINGVLDQILSKYLSDDGIVQVYFDKHRPRTDPVVCVNALTLFYAYGREHQLNRTEQWIFDVLVNRSYNQGTRYYATPESFLFFLARLFKYAPSVRRRMSKIYIKRLEERLGRYETDPMSIAMRLLSAHTLGITKTTSKQLIIDLEQLYALQRIDGSWDDGPLYKYGSQNISIGNRGLTTALAINAIRTHQTKESILTLNTHLFLLFSILCFIYFIFS